MRNPDSLQDEIIQSDSYRGVLSNYSYNNQYLMRNGFKKLKQDMGFTQIRFYCFKKEIGRVFHIMTNKNSKGTDVVNFFTTSDTIPVACGSFTRLPDDNSSLAVNCDKWGVPTSNRWGQASFLTDDRLFKRPVVWRRTSFFQMVNANTYRCDDKEKSISLPRGDTWQIFVR